MKKNRQNRQKQNISSSSLNSDLGKNSLWSATNDQIDPDRIFRGWKYYPIIVKYITYTFLISPVLLASLSFVFSPFSIYIFVPLMMALSLSIIWFVPNIQLKNLRILQAATNKSTAFDNERDILKLSDDMRKTMAQIIGGVFFAAGLAVTYYTYDLTKQRAIFEQFSEAVKLIKDRDQSVRTAGLYELQSISIQSAPLRPAIWNTIFLYVNNQSKRILGQNSYDCESYEKENNMDIEIAAQTIIEERFAFSKKYDETVLEDPFLNKSDFSGKRLGKITFNHGCLNHAKFAEADISLSV